MGGLQIDSTPAFLTREEFAAHKLREAILLGHLKPGDRLDQNEIAELLGISRSPVRDALRTLAAEGLVEVVPHRGAAVAELSADEVEEIFLIRRILEGMAARLATQRIGPVQLAELQAILDEIDRTTDLDGWLELNRRFHHTLYQAANRPRLFSIVENLRNTTAPYVRLFIVTAEHIESAQESHRRIVRACAARDGIAAERETQQHMDAVCAGVLEYMKAQMIPQLDVPAEERLSLSPVWSTPAP